MIFRISVAAELAPMGSPSGLRQLRHPEIVPLSGDLGIPSLLERASPKIDTRYEKHRIPFKQSKNNIDTSPSDCEI